MPTVLTKPVGWDERFPFPPKVTLLNAILQPDGTLLRVLDPKTGKVLPTTEEAVDEAEIEAQRANTAEAEAARLRAEVERLLRRLPNEDQPGQQFGHPG